VETHARLKLCVRFSEAMKTGLTTHGSRKACQALVAAAASTVGVVVLIAMMDVWPVLPDVYPTIVAIAGVAAVFGIAWKPLPWYFSAIVGAGIGFACAVGVATYAISKI
jgi:hypothetical protein